MTTISTPASSKETSPDLWPTFGKKICKWIETMLVHGEGDSYGKPFRLRADQKLLIYNWYEYEADGYGRFVRWRYDELYLEFATGWGKTEIGAALALAELTDVLGMTTSPNVPIAAASYEQADLLYGRAKQIVAHENCRLRPFIQNGEDGGFDTEMLLKDKPGRMFRTAAVAGTNEGGLPSLFMADEIHEWTGGKERVYTVISKSRRKRANARTINMSTPGHDLDTLAGRMHTVGAEGTDPRMLFVTHTADPTLELSDPVQLRTAIEQANPWKSADQIDSLVYDFDKMPQHEFARYHLCQWVEVPEDSWLIDKPGALDACRGDASFGNGPTAMAIDMSLKHDTTSISTVQLRADGRKPERTKIFTADPNTGRIDFLAVRQYVMSEARRSGARSVGYDPRFLEFEAQELADAGVPMEEFPQSPERMAPATALAYRDIIDQVLVHDGNAEFLAHVNAAVKRDTDRGMTLTKGKSKGPIDGCISWVMANAIVSTFVPEPAQPGRFYSF